MSTDDILDAIDRAVHDWEFSDDAMRWTPEPPRPQSPAAGTRVCDMPAGHVYIRDETHEWTEVGTTSPDSIAWPSQTNDEGETNVRPWWHGEPVTVTFSADTARFVEAFAHLAESVGQSMRAFENSVKRSLASIGRPAHLLHAQLHPKDHIRCRACNPFANPPPLKVDGREYTRRRKNRRRR